MLNSSGRYTHWPLSSRSSRQFRYSCAQVCFSRDTVLADKPFAFGPTKTSKAAPISPVDIPFKYSQGSAASNVWVLRTYGGTSGCCFSEDSGLTVAERIPARDSKVFNLSNGINTIFLLIFSVMLLFQKQ